MSLLERESDLQSLYHYAQGAAAGRGVIVLVAGEAGIGKTTLLSHFADAQRAKARVFWGGCEALFTPHPLAPLFDMARQAGGAFGAAIAATDRRDTVFNLTMDHLADKSKPAIVIFEDVHWADEATLDLIKFIGRRLQNLHVMLVVSYRDDEVDAKHPLRAVIGDLPAACLRRLHPRHLSSNAVATLAAAAGRHVTGLHEATGGNPFFVTEALAGAGDVVPATVRDAVMARLARLSVPARAIADLVSLVPGKTERWLLEKTAPRAAAAIEECLAVGMVELSDGAIAFRHELARRAVEECQPIARRQDIHATILEALMRHFGGEIAMARLVHHADQSNDSAVVLRYAPRAAERAKELGAHREAAAHYETALRHAAALSAEQRAELQEHLSYEFYLTEHIPEAIAARHAALAYWKKDGCLIKIGDNLRWLSRLTWFNGQKDAADQYAQEAIATLEAATPSRELAMAYSNRAQLHMLANEVAATKEWGSKAIAIAEPLGDQEVLSHAFNNVGTARVTALDLAGRADLEHSLNLALTHELQEHAGRAYTNLATVSLRQRDFASADRYLAAGLAYCEEKGLDSWLRYMISTRAMSSLAQGDWERATDDAIAVFLHPCSAPISMIQALVALGLVRARRGDPDVDGPLNQGLELAMPTSEAQRIGAVVAARAEAAWLKGELISLQAEITEALALANAQSDPWVQGELSYWAWRAGLPIGDPGSIMTPFGLQVGGKPKEAAAMWAAMGCEYERAVALSDSLEEPDLRLALEIASRLSAQPLAGIIRRKLRSVGVRGITRGAQARTRQNPHGLTVREMGVLSLLTLGGRNADIARRLFVSEKTVDHHVSSILGKLGVRSRGEAAAAAHRLGLSAPPERSVAKK